jgi:hypothetical protein
MTTHRTTRARVSNPPTPDNPTRELAAEDTGRRECPDVDDTLHATRDALWKADACITAAERLIKDRGVGIDSADEDGGDEYGHGGDDDPGRLRNHLEEYVESAKLAVREAQYAHSRTIDTVEEHNAESNRATETARRRGGA